MNDGWLAIIWVALFVVVGAVFAVGMLLRARTVQARADAQLQQRYRELAEQSVASQEATAAQLAELTSRVAAVERLLKEVG